MPVDVANQIVYDEIFPVAGNRRVDVEASVEIIPGIRSDHDHLLHRASVNETVHRDPHVQILIRPLYERAMISRESVKEIHNWISAMPLLRIARRQINRHRSAVGIAYEIVAERRSGNR